MNKNPDNLHLKANAGFGLVDVMVGMVIGLLGVIIIFQVFSVSEGIKRTTTSGGDAQQNGATSLFVLERSLKTAGYGIFSNTNPPPTPQDCADAPACTLPVAPVTITAGAANTSDTIALTYRPANGANSWDYGPFPPASGVGFTAPPALVVPTETITVQTNCNGNGSALLQLCSSLNGVISDGIVLMKAEYGIDTNADRIVDTWTQTAPTAANVLNTLAVRIVLVARSAQPEDKDASGRRVSSAGCATTTTPPTWVGSTAGTGQAVAIPLLLTGQADLVAAGDNWQCYRYKTYEDTVPLLNVIWRP